MRLRIRPPERRIESEVERARDLISGREVGRTWRGGLENGRKEEERGWEGADWDGEGG